MHTARLVPKSTKTIITMPRDLNTFPLSITVVKNCLTLHQCVFFLPPLLPVWLSSLLISLLWSRHIRSGSPQHSAFHSICLCQIFLDKSRQSKSKMNQVCPVICPLLCCAFCCMLFWGEPSPPG